MTTQLSESDLIQLPPALRNHAMQFEGAARRGELFAASVWGAVFIEGLLGEWLRSLGSNDKRELGDQIAALRGILKGQNSKNIEDYDDVLRRINEVRSVRNRLVHDTKAVKDTIENDYQFINTQVIKLIDLMRQIGVLSSLNSSLHIPDPKASHRSLGYLYLCHTKTRTIDQKIFLATLKEEFRQRRINPLTLTHSRFDIHQKYSNISRRMRDCAACLAIGFRGSTMMSLTNEKGEIMPVSESDFYSDIAYVSTEIGIAHALTLPIYVLCEHTFPSIGVFERFSNEFVAIEIDILEIQDSNVAETVSRIEKLFQGSRIVGNVYEDLRVDDRDLFTKNPS